jgi:PAS domain S-box-containing protein
MDLTSPGRAWLRAAQPRSLRHQMLLLLAAVTAVAIGMLSVLSSARMEESARHATEDWARSLASNAAASALPLLQDRGGHGDEAALRALAGLPGVATLVVRDAQGQDRLVLRRASDGRVLRQEGVGGSRDIATRSPEVQGAQSLPAAAAPFSAESTLQTWSVVGPGGSLGSVGVSVSMDVARDHFAALRYDGVLAVGFTGLALLAAVYLFLARTLSALNRLVTFAGELAANAGAHHAVPSSNRELSELGTALNDASAMLRNQLDVLVSEQARTLAIVNAVPDVILGLDGDCNVAIVNPGVSSVFGLPPEEMRGLPLQDFLPGIDQAEAESRTMQGLYMRSTRTHVARFEITARRHDGTEFPAEVSLSRIETEEGARYAAMVRDVTEQRMSMAMLNLYCRALECTSNGVVISDMSLPGSPVFYANPAFYRITGFDPGYAIGRNCDFLQKDDKAQPEIEQLRKAVAEGGSTQVVLRNYRKDGSLFFNELAIAPVAEADGSIKHYVGVLNDVTERERSRMAIAERSARLNNVFDLSPDGFVVFDAAGQMAYCNRAFQAMTGWEASDAALSVAEFDRRFALLCSSAGDYEPVKALVDGEGGVDSAHTLMLALPEHRVLARVVRSASSCHGESILFFRDVTRETEVDRMKSEFLTTAAHELRTPMVSVFGFTELLLRRPVPEARRKDMLETIHRQASLLINMVNELLDLARIEARQGKDLKREACRLDSLITQAVGPLVGAGGPHRFELDIGHGDVSLWVDPEKTHRALINVLSNAVKYSPAGGSIFVRTHSGRLRGEAAVGLEVEDQGIGMTADQVARVFERFYRADPSGNIPGTGLGMSLVKEIVELQGGRIDLQSQPGKGTRVTLWLPQPRPGLEAPTPRQDKLPGPQEDTTTCTSDT